MKLTIERNLLLKGLSHVRSIVERRTTIPILSNMVLAASSEFGLQLRATDLEREVLETIGANVFRGRRHDGVGTHALRHRQQAAEGR